MTLGFIPMGGPELLIIAVMVGFLVGIFWLIRHFTGRKK